MQIAKRLGIADQCCPRLANVPDDKWDEAIDNLHREAYEKWALMKEIVPLHPPSWEEFLKKPVFRWEVKEPYYTYKNAIEAARIPFRERNRVKSSFILEKSPQVQSQFRKY